MARKPDFDRVQVKEAIIEAGGNVARAAKLLGTERQTVYNYINRYKSLRGLVEIEREKRRKYRIDLAENNLDQALEDGDWNATRLVLKTIGKKYGYSESLQLEGNELNPVQVATQTADEWKKKTEERARKAGRTLTE